MSCINFKLYCEKEVEGSFEGTFYLIGTFDLNTVKAFFDCDESKAREIMNAVVTLPEGRQFLPVSAGSLKKEFIEMIEDDIEGGMDCGTLENDTICLKWVWSPSLNFGRCKDVARLDNKVRKVIAEKMLEHGLNKGFAIVPVKVGYLVKLDDPEPTIYADKKVIGSGMCYTVPNEQLVSDIHDGKGSYPEEYYEFYYDIDAVTKKVNTYIDTWPKAEDIKLLENDLAWMISMLMYCEGRCLSRMEVKTTWFNYSESDEDEF